MLFLGQRPPSAEGHMLNISYEFARAAFFDHMQRAVPKRQLQATSGEVAAENQVARTGGDVDEAACAGGDVWLGRQPRHIDIAIAVDLHEREQAAIEAATLKIGELIRRRNQRLCIRCTAKLKVE